MRCRFSGTGRAAVLHSRRWRGDRLDTLEYVSRLSLRLMLRVSF